MLGHPSALSHTMGDRGSFYGLSVAIRAACAPNVILTYHGMMDRVRQHRDHSIEQHQSRFPHQPLRKKSMEAPTRSSTAVSSNKIFHESEWKAFPSGEILERFSYSQRKLNFRYRYRMGKPICSVRAASGEFPGGFLGRPSSRGFTRVRGAIGALAGGWTIGVRTDFHRK